MSEGKFSSCDGRFMMVLEQVLNEVLGKAVNGGKRNKAWILNGSRM